MHEDEDIKSDGYSYWYWAFHFVMIGSICYLGLFTCMPQTEPMKLCLWYCQGLFGILIAMTVAWTEFFPMVAKGRTFL